MKGRLRYCLLLSLVSCQTEDPEGTVRKTIGIEGGIISSHDKRLTIVLQPGALDTDTEIIIFPSDEPPPIYGAAYRVQPDIDLHVNAEVTYRRPLPPANPNIVAVAAIKMDDYVQGMGYWEPLPRLFIDPTNDAVTGKDDQLSLYYGMYDFRAPVEETEGMPMGCDADISDCFISADYGAGLGPRDVCVGDFNGDGQADAATANAAADNVAIMFGDGIGGFGAPGLLNVGATPTTIGCGQLDAGVHWDFAVALADGTVRAALSDGSGSFVLVDPVTVPEGPVELALIDLQGDGFLDIPVATSSGAVASVNFGRDEMGAPVLTFVGQQPTAPFVGAPTGLAVGSLNMSSDMVPDVFVFGGTTAVSALGAGNGGFGPFNDNTELRIGSALAKGSAGDVNGDNLVDVVVADSGMGGVHILENQGNGIDFIASFESTGAGAVDAVVGDFNGDGLRSDIAVVNATASTVTFLIRVGAAWTNAGELPVGTGASAIAGFDINLDGTQDVIVSNETDNTITALFSI